MPRTVRASNRDSEGVSPTLPRSVHVFGPAYLDRVLRVIEPLLGPDFGVTLDLSVGGSPVDGPAIDGLLTLLDPAGGRLEIETPDGWPEPFEAILLDRLLAPSASPWSRRVQGSSWRDDLGGMGAGYAKALGGVLDSALGPASDPFSVRIAAMLQEQGIEHRPTVVPQAVADWTLLVSSGPHGDKLPIGFRGCHTMLGAYPLPVGPTPDVLVVASLSNRLAASALRSVEAPVRVFAPTLRNMTDNDPPLGRFADRVDLLCCNRQEWDALDDQATVLGVVPVVSVTDGPAGALIHYRDHSGHVRRHIEPAFPRARPPVDTNRAGEAFASTLLTALLDRGWTRGLAVDDQIREAARRASAASALVLDCESFGFPDVEAIDAALDRGLVP